MRVLATCSIILALMIVVLVPRDARAERATQEEMELVCQNWLAYTVHEQGGWAGDSHPSIVDVSELVQGDTVLARCFAIAPRGYITVPILKELPPIQAYSEEYGIDVNQTVGFPLLLKDVLLNRVRNYVQAFGSMDAIQPLRGAVVLDPAHRQEWNRFLASRESFDADLQRGALERRTQVGPLLTTSWFQSAPYNRLCPDGDGGRCLVGCVATAAAQIMRYHQWPLNGTGSHNYTWDGDQSCGGNTLGLGLTATFTDLYDWANMPDSCDLGCPSADSAALSELCYEIGVAFEMDYGHCSSEAWTYDALTVFPTYFRYSNTIDREDRSSYTATTWFNLIKGEINAGRPMQYRISGHSIVCDGWRDTGGLNQYHMNYGWGDAFTTWYTIDNLYCNWSGCNTMVEYVIRNIIPVRELSGALSGTLGPGTYTVIGNISISAGNTLTPQPGVVLNFAGPYSFSISGWLLAEGTVNDSIVFTSNQSGANRWHGLRFTGAGSSGSVLNYCRIEKGYANGEDEDGYGGGVYCNQSSPSFSHCRIIGNTAVYCGGGVQCYWNSSPTFDLCEISGDTAGCGGGVDCEFYSSPYFNECRISDNSASSGGGGVACRDFSSPTFIACTVSGNSAPDGGGGVSCYYSASPSFTNCAIESNSATSGGGGLLCYESSPSFASCTLYGNSTSMNGGGAYIAASSPVFINTIIAFSTGSGLYFWAAAGSNIRYCDIFGNSGGEIAFSDGDPSNGPGGIGQLWGLNANGDSCDTYGNIFLDPLFANAPAGDLHLTDYSPCIGAGIFSELEEDFEHDPRPNPSESRQDVGMDEHWLAGPVRHLVIRIVGGNAVLSWPFFAYTVKIYGTTAPFTAGILLTTTGSTTWTDNQTSSRPSPYFYYVTAGE